MTDVAKFYRDVINDVINGVKDEWVDEGLDLQVLDELKKSWTNKLAQTHVYAQEPVTNSAAQYLDLVQRSILHIRPSTGLNPMQASLARSLPTAGRMVAPAIGLSTTNTSTGSHIRPVQSRPSFSQPQPMQLAHLGGGGIRLTQTPSSLPTQSQAALVHSSLMSNLQSVAHCATTPLPAHAQPRSVLTGIPSGSAPQLAALPSGLTGHLVQIGQQTYLVPQQLVGMRAPSQGLGALPQFVGNISTTTTSQAINMADVSGFPRTQVDGGADDLDETMYSATPGSQPTPGSAANNPLASQSVGVSELDEDDDDDDDDFVAATPGSVRPNFHHRLMSSNVGQSSSYGTPLTGPPTPMSPPSVASRTSYDTPRRLSRNQSTADRPRPGSTPQRKRRKNSSCISGAGGADLDTDDDEIGEEVELMTNATMTPADHGVEFEDEYDDDEDDDDEHEQMKNRRRRRNDQPHDQSVLISPDTKSGDRSAVGTELAPDIQKDDGEDGEEDAADDDEPLNSEDDVSDEEPEVLFESDNVVVCQYDKIHRARNRWRFHLKDGIMSINGRDHVFQKAVGEAEW